jgi:hypothetical protein
MMRLSRRACVPAALLLLAACNMCVAYDEELDGPYRLMAIDVREQMSVVYGSPDGSGTYRIGETVFAVGWDRRHLIAKRHPDGDSTRTEYYVLEREKDSPTAPASASVRGPFDSVAFEQARQTLGVAPTVRFTRLLRELE